MLKVIIEVAQLHQIVNFTYVYVITYVYIILYWYYIKVLLICIT